MTEARQRATSDFERDVLADGKITDQEVQQGRELFKTCMEDRGHVVSLATDGGYTVQPPGTEAQMDADVYECETGTSVLIETTALSIRSNPDNEDWLQLGVDCLVRNRIAPPGYTVKDYDSLDDPLQNPPSVAFVNCGEDPKNYVATEADKATPFGMS